jgi:hypothetical protein
MSVSIHTRGSHAQISIFVFVTTFIFLQLAFCGLVFSQQVSAPVAVTTTYNTDGPTLAIPRWKGFMLESNPNEFWLSYGQRGSSSTNIRHTTNGGTTWSSNVFQVWDNGYLNEHVSLFGKNGNLYFTWPAGSYLYFRRIRAPAHSNSDRDPVRLVPGGTGEHRSSVMVQDNGRVWVFTRRAYNSSQNVLYHYSDDNGATWTNGVAFATNCQNVRIGSMPYIGGNPALVVFYMNDSRGYEYYLWNGSSFVARPDCSIYPANMGETRVFTHQVVRDSIFHLIFGLGNNLRHVWKNYSNGQGAWRSQVIDTSPYTSNNDWFTSSTVRGGELYLFYTKKSSSDFATSKIYYKKWDQTTQTWTTPVLVSAQLSYNRDPNTCFEVPSSSDYIPVFWNAGTGSVRTIYFAKIQLGSMADYQGPADGDSPVGIREMSDLPVTLASNGYPNPFNAQITIEYTLGSPGDVRVEIYDVLGRRVETLVEQYQEAGIYQATWNAGDNNSGVYFYRVQSGDLVDTRKVILMK